MIIGGFDELPIGETVTLNIFNKELNAIIPMPLYIKREATREEYLKQQEDKGLDESNTELVKDSDSLFYEALMN